MQRTVMVHYQVQTFEPLSNSAGTQSLTEDGIVLPKHVAAIVKSKETYNLVHLLVCLYITNIIFEFRAQTAIWFTHFSSCDKK
jgi:hypothetical protein